MTKSRLSFIHSSLTASYRFYVEKSTWRGNYPRILQIDYNSIKTFNPINDYLTNDWHLDSVSKVSLDENDDKIFYIHLKHFSSALKFSCVSRCQLLTELIRSIQQLPMSSSACNFFLSPTSVFQCKQYSREGLESDNRLLEIGYCSIHLTTSIGESIASYDYQHIQSISKTFDEQCGMIFSFEFFQHEYYFLSNERDEIIEKIIIASKRLGKSMDIYATNSGFDFFTEEKQQILSYAELIASYVIQKQNFEDESVSVTKKLVITESLLIEHEYDLTGDITYSRELKDIIYLIRDADNCECFQIQFYNGLLETYYSKSRDQILLHLLSAFEQNQNTKVNKNISLECIEHCLPMKDLIYPSYHTSSPIIDEAPYGNYFMHRLSKALECNVPISLYLDQMNLNHEKYKIELVPQEEAFRLIQEFNNNIPLSSSSLILSSSSPPSILHVINGLIKQLASIVFNHLYFTSISCIAHCRTLYRLMNQSTEVMKEIIKIDSLMYIFEKVLDLHSSDPKPLFIYWILKIVFYMMNWAKTNQEEKIEKEYKQKIISQFKIIKKFIYLFQYTKDMERTQQNKSDLLMFEMIHFFSSIIHSSTTLSEDKEYILNQLQKEMDYLKDMMSMTQHFYVSSHCIKLYKILQIRKTKRTNSLHKRPSFHNFEDTVEKQCKSRKY